MRKIGSYLAFFGIGTIVLNLFNMEFTFLSWIYNWGEGVAWAIKIGLVVIGAVLFFMGKPEPEETELELPKEESGE